MKRLMALALLLSGGAALAAAPPRAAARKAAPPAPAAGPRMPAPYRAPDRMPDAMEVLPPSAVRMGGYLGVRVLNSEKNRLVAVDEAPLLAGFRHKPGEQAWIGEHVGKWLHAATLAWANTGDPALRTKLDRVAAELIKTQEPDGYLGTYVPEKRFGLYPDADWDVWVHKYDLIGLLTYHQYTGNAAALDACRKVGDLLIRTFGPGKKSILSAGTHMGMAATSVLEPMVLLYRTTADPRYLEFARYIVASWDEPNGPKILQTLTTEKSVAKTANGKAYEMLSNLVGLCELARATGERRYLEPALNAWQDVVAHQLYITGTASFHEHFHADYELPNQPGADVGETCVTVTWIQLNAQLLRLTGDARYGDELERSYYNHLAGAQRPDGALWSYYTALEGTKPYGPGINCCVSSGPRGMALAPQLTFLKYRQGRYDGIGVNLFESSAVTTRLGGALVTLTQDSQFPRSGSSVLTLHMDRPAMFGLKVRSPGWTQALELRASGDRGPVRGPQGGWAEIPARPWKDGDRIGISFNVPSRVVTGEHTNAGRQALTWGPLVLAYDEAKNPGVPVRTVRLADEASKPAVSVASPLGAPLTFTARVRTTRDAEPTTAVFVPFAEAGVTGSRYQVWLREAGATDPPNESLLAEGDETRSREGNATGAINDGDPASFVVTYDNHPRVEDWFAVSLTRPVAVRRIVFAHGRSFHDGGWFDASAGKPRVQIRRQGGSLWETVGVLEEYPATTATDSAGLRDGQSFTLRLAAPVPVVAVRVIGKPASGDRPTQAFASCAELQAFPE
jgi:DUF1680 family protein